MWTLRLRSLCFKSLRIRKLINYKLTAQVDPVDALAMPSLQTCVASTFGRVRPSHACRVIGKGAAVVVLYDCYSIDTVHDVTRRRTLSCKNSVRAWQRLLPHANSGV